MSTALNIKALTVQLIVGEPIYPIRHHLHPDLEIRKTTLHTLLRAAENFVILMGNSLNE